MKKWISSIGIILLLISVLVGCQAEKQAAVGEEGVNEKNSVNVEPVILESSEIQEVINTQIEAINAHDGDLYLSTIHQGNTTYYNEAKYFANKLSTANYSDYQLSIKEIRAISPSEAILTLSQNYTQNGQVNEVTFNAHFIKVENQWLDDDVAFESIQVGNLIVLYMPDVLNVEEMIADVEKSLKNVESVFPEPITGLVEIKLYSDQELLRQKTDFGIEWLFTGWAEEGHAIKAFTGQSDDYSYEALFTHELIHKLTIFVSNGNMPIWLAEALAIHYGTNQVNQGNYIDLGKSTASAMRMSIVELSELNMEIMDNREDIMAYYGAAGMVAYYLSETYGDESVFKIYQTLGEYPRNDISSEPNWHAISDQRLREVVQKVLNKDFEALSEAYLVWYNTLY